MFDAWVEMVVDAVDSPMASSPFWDSTRVILTDCSWPGAPIMTCILSKYSLLKLACFNRTLYRAPGVVRMYWRMLLCA